MATAIKVKLNQLYGVRAASEPTPASYTPATIEIYASSSDVTIRATTKPDYAGGYADLPVITTEAEAGEIYECELTRAVRFLSFSCDDPDAEIYVSGFTMTEIEEPEL